MISGLPKKLKADAIIEAVLELRFEPEPNAIAEVLIGRFADTSQWKSFSQSRLPVADIPAALRRADPNLRYQPVIQMVSPDGAIYVGIGDQVVVFSRRGTYPGWDVFGPELDKVVARLYEITPSVKVSRVGFRYINALRSDHHKINSIDDLNLAIKVAGKVLNRSVNLNYKVAAGNGLAVMARIASVDLAQGAIPEKATVVLDIDVYTEDGYSATDSAIVQKCIKDAHTVEKETFFAVLGEEVTARLKEV